jgi:ATP-binding cassette, subfamily B, bacterial PglK
VTARLIRVAMTLLSVRDRRLLLLATVAQFLVSLLDLVGVFLLGIVAAIATAYAIGGAPSLPANIGQFLPQDPSGSTLLLLALVSAGCLILKSVLSFLITRRVFRFLANRQAVIAGNLASRLLTQPLMRVQGRSMTETTFALTAGVNAITQQVLGQAMVIVSEGSLILVLGVSLLFVSPSVTIFVAVFFGALTWGLHSVLGSRAQRLGCEQTEAEMGSYSAIQDALRTYREISVLGRRSFVISRFQQLRWRVAQVIANLYMVNQASKYVFEIGLVVGGALLIFFVARAETLSAAIGLFTIFLVASSRLFPSLIRLQGALATIRNAEALAGTSLSLAAELGKPAPNEQSDLEVAGARALRELNNGYLGFTGTVDLTEVSLTYAGSDSPAVSQIDLHLRAGESLAITGSTGAGKSTLADLILGVHVPDTGRVVVSGTSPREVIGRWPGAIAYVPQHVAVVEGSIRDNVALGLPHEAVSDERVWEALERAHLAALLRHERQGLDTAVGDQGVALSGGQRQRLGIARALYSRPSLLVLDEATSALDADTEHLVTDTFRELAGDVTLIVIAHRLATIREFESVVFLHRGRVQAQGSFEDVRARVPDFDRQARLLGL